MILYKYVKQKGGKLILELNNKSKRDEEGRVKEFDELVSSYREMDLSWPLWPLPGEDIYDTLWFEFKEVKEKLILKKVRAHLHTKAFRELLCALGKNVKDIKYERNELGGSYVICKLESFSKGNKMEVI